MFKNKLLKVLALLMVLNILIIPLTNFIPQHQNKYTVHASGELVDIRFFNAMVSMIGVTAVGITGMMSQNFTIPEVDMVALKDQFQATLDADATKKTAWLNAQSDYLAGGVAKTMGASELAKIGINDVYNNFTNYLKTINPVISKIPDGTTTLSKNYELSSGTLKVVKTIQDINQFVHLPKSYNLIWRDGLSFQYMATTVDENIFDGGYIYQSSYSINGSSFGIQIMSNGIDHCASISGTVPNTGDYQLLRLYINELASFGIDIVGTFPQGYFENITGTVNYSNTGDIVNTTDTTKSIIPTIPWISTDIPIGTVVTPAITAPYAGAIPIDIPITAPIDPPIDYPVDPPADTTLLGTVAAILAGLTPIAGFLEYILAGQVSLTDAIEAGLTNVVDGIGDIAGTLTGGISSTLTDIKTGISTLFDPPTETLDTDKLKNINSVLFTKFPFSIPFDFTRMLGAFNADPVAPVLKIPFDMSSFGGENTMLEFDLSQFDYIASIVRQISFIGFVFFMLFNTRKLIWK